MVTLKFYGNAPKKGILFLQTAGCACNTPCVASLGGLIKQINRSQCSLLKNIGTKDEQQRKKKLKYLQVDTCRILK